MADIKWSEKTLVVDPNNLKNSDFLLYVNAVELVNYRVELDTFFQFLSKKINKLYQPDGTNPFVYTDNGGALHVDGTIIQNGASYETELETVKVKNAYVFLREGAVGGLAPGEFAGFEVVLYDGSVNGRLVMDSLGTARVGDAGDELPLCVRKESADMDASGITFWSNSLQSVETSPKLTQVDGRILSNGISAYSDGVQAGEDIVARLVNQFSDVGTATVIRMINSTSVVSDTGGEIVTERTDSQAEGTNKMVFRTSNAVATWLDAFEIENGNMCLLDNEINDVGILRGRSGDGFLTFRFEQAGAFLNLYGGFTSASMAKFFENGDAYIAGDLGIGTESPAEKLDVAGNANISGLLSISRNADGLLNLNTTSATGNPLVQILQNDIRRSYIQHNDADDVLKIASEYGSISLLTGTGGTEVETVQVSQDNKVGIGVSNPTKKLEVSGDAKTTNGIVSGIVFTQTSDQTVGNTATETSLIGSGSGSITIPAGTLTEGKQIRIKDSGYITTATSSNSTTFRIKFGGTTLVTSVATIPNSLSDAYVELEFTITVRSGNVIIGKGRTFINDQNSALGSAMRGLVMTTPVSFNPAIDNDIDLTYQWGTASATRTVTVTQTSIEILN